jgi:putative flippase GtrA
VANADFYFKIKFIIIPLFLIVTPAWLAISKAISHRIAIIWQIAKFVDIGILNTLVDWTLILLMSSFRNYIKIEPTYNIIFGIAIYSLYKSISFVVATINSYYWNKYWTFSQGDTKRAKTEFFQFLIASTIGFGINVAVSSYVFSYVRLGSFHINQWA